ncbi:MAG: hypothetical protein AABZ44_05535 [Elusimicrobiota bacterium]
MPQAHTGRRQAATYVLAAFSLFLFVNNFSFFFKNNDLFIAPHEGVSSALDIPPDAQTLEARYKAWANSSSGDNYLTGSTHRLPTALLFMLFSIFKFDMLAWNSFLLIWLALHFAVVWLLVRRVTHDTLAAWAAVILLEIHPMIRENYFHVANCIHQYGSTLFALTAIWLLHAATASDSKGKHHPLLLGLLGMSSVMLAISFHTTWIPLLVIFTWAWLAIGNKLNGVNKTHWITLTACAGVAVILTGIHMLSNIHTVENFEDHLFKRGILHKGFDPYEIGVLPLRIGYALEDIFIHAKYCLTLLGVALLARLWTFTTLSRRVKTVLTVCVAITLAAYALINLDIWGVRHLYRILFPALAAALFIVDAKENRLRPLAQSTLLATILISAAIFAATANVSPRGSMRLTWLAVPMLVIFAWPTLMALPRRLGASAGRSSIQDVGIGILALLTCLGVTLNTYFYLQYRDEWCYTECRVKSWPIDIASDRRSEPGFPRKDYWPLRQQR